MNINKATNMNGEKETLEAIDCFTKHCGSNYIIDGRIRVTFGISYVYFDDMTAIRSNITRLRLDDPVTLEIAESLFSLPDAASRLAYLQSIAANQYDH